MEKDRLKFCISRYDHFYESVNNKSNLLLAVCTFIVGMLIAAYTIISEKIFITCFIRAFYMICVILGIGSILILLFAAIPYLTSKSHFVSLHYFSSVSNLNFEDFSKFSREMTKDEELADLRRQTHLLASGISRKFNVLRIVYILMMLQLMAIIPLLILILKN